MKLFHKIRIRAFLFVMLLSVLAVLLGWDSPAPTQAKGLSQESAESFTITFSDLGRTELLMNGLYGQDSLFIPMRSDWVIEEPIRVTVTYAASPLLDQSRSTLTILANDVEVTSIRPIANGNLNSFSFFIPKTHVADWGVDLTFRSFLTLPELVCRETNDPGQWLVISGDSQITMTPFRKLEKPTLDQLPQAVMVQSAGEYEDVAEVPPTVFVLPDNPNDTTLQAAANVAIGLGYKSDARLFEVETNSSLTERQRNTSNLVLIGLPEDLPIIKDLGAVLPNPLTPRGFVMPFATPEDELIEDNKGVLQIINSPWDSLLNVLIVSANAEPGLLLAGRAIADREMRQSFKDASALVDPADFAVLSGTDLAWMSDTTTLRQLGFSDRGVIGTGKFQLYYTFNRPPGWALLPGSQLGLSISHSPNLIPDESQVAVYINEILIGSSEVGGETPAGNLVFDLPVDQINQTPDGMRPQSILLRVQIINNLREEDCVDTHQEAAWLVIEDDTYFVTPHTYVPLPDLQAFPYPFVSDQASPPTVIVMPDDPLPTDLEAGLLIANTLGRYGPGSVEVELIPSSQLNEEQYSDSNLIILGFGQRQPLYDQFSEGFELLPEGAINHIRDNPGAGQLWTSQSPWNEDRMALLLYSKTSDGFTEAVSALFLSTPPVEEGGNFAVTTGDLETRVLARSANLHEPLVVTVEGVQTEKPEEGEVVGESGAVKEEATGEAEAEPAITPPAAEVPAESTDSTLIIGAIAVVVVATLAVIVGLYSASRRQNRPPNP
jgi:hypothetical protein